MKSWITVRLGVAIAALLTAGTMAGAQAPGGGPGWGEHRTPFERALGPQGKQGHWWNNPEMIERLKLTDDQRKQMDGILFEHRESLIDMRANVEKAELEMEPLMREDQPNETKILAQIDKVAQARAELEKANARFLLAIRGKLTADQWKLLQAERADRRGGRDGGHEGWGGRGGPRPDGERQHQGPPPPGGAGPQSFNHQPPAEQPVAPAEGAQQ